MPAGPSNRASTARALALGFAADALEVLARDGVERRIAAQQQDDAARNRERHLLDPEAQVADEERLGGAGLRAEQPDEHQLAHALAGRRRRDERAEGHDR